MALDGLCHSRTRNFSYLQATACSKAAIKCFTKARCLAVNPVPGVHIIFFFTAFGGCRFLFVCFVVVLINFNMHKIRVHIVYKQVMGPEDCDEILLLRVLDEKN